MSVCYHCGDPATLLCDGILARRRGEYVHPPELSHPRFRTTTGYWAVNPDDPTVTCDRPLCRACARHVGTVFFSPRMGGWDTRDLCRGCENVSGLDKPLVTDEEAEAIRRRRLIGKAAVA